VIHIGSSGLCELVGAYATGANQGAQIKLLNVQKRVHNLLQVTKLYTVFESFASEISALRTGLSRRTPQPACIDLILVMCGDNCLPKNVSFWS